MDNELRDIFSTNGEMISDDYITGLAQTKRFLELWSMEPGFQAEFSQKPEETLQKYGLAVDVLSMNILVDPEMALKYITCPQEEIPLLVRRYRNFIREKIESRDELARRLCIPEQKKFQAWRQRQINRCWWELGTKNGSLIHTPLMFEVTAGCSVGCPFCGVAAKQLSQVFLYTEENSALWRRVLQHAHELIGDAAGTGTCYYATEPLDNVDYEKFTHDYYKEFNTFPQLTTAVAMRNPERTRLLLEKMKEKVFRVHRFSVLSLEIFHQIMAFFTPEELLEIELLPQFVEAPACLFSNAGRARSIEKREKIADSSDAEATIACISGFVVNMAEKTIRLVTPWQVDCDHPTGERFLAQTEFCDADDFIEKLTLLIDRHMVDRLPSQQVLKILSDVSCDEIEDKVVFHRSKKFKVEFSSQELEASIYRDIASLLTDGKYTAREIAEKLAVEKEIFPANVFHILGKIFAAGLLVEA